MKGNLEISDCILQDIMSKVGDKLKLFVVIGSRNYPRFFTDISDLDVLIVFDSLSTEILNFMAELRDSYSRNHSIKIDIKVFTLADFYNGNNFFINTWFYKALEKKKERTIYISKGVAIPKVSNRTDMILPITYCMYKLRKIFLKSEFNKRGKVGKLDRDEEIKDIVSTFFSIVKFSLAYFGKYVFSPEEIIIQSEKLFGRRTSKLLRESYNIKLTFKRGSDDLHKYEEEIFSESEKIYADVTTNLANKTL